MYKPVKVISKHKDAYKDNPKKGKDQQLKIDSLIKRDHGPNKSSMHDAIYKWYNVKCYDRMFSKSLPDRIKLVTIENKWFTKIISQMNKHRTMKQKTKFSFKSSSINFRNNDNDIDKDFEIFSINNFCTTDDIDNYLINEDTFIKEIRFFSVTNKFDTITLSSKLLSDENWLKDLVNTFSKGQAFHYYTSK